MIQTTARIKVAIPNMTRTSCRSQSVISQGLIPSDRKKLACPGLKTIYARNAPKNMRVTRSIAHTMRRNVPVLMDFFGIFFGGVGASGDCIFCVGSGTSGFVSAPSMNDSDRRSNRGSDEVSADDKISPRRPPDVFGESSFGTSGFSLL